MPTIRTRFPRHPLPGLAALLLLAAPLPAQTDYYNLDKHRPLRVEDAMAVERHAVELQLSPLTAVVGGAERWRYEPGLELKYGVLPGMEIGAGIDGRIVRAAGETERALGALELSTLYNLNSETVRLPAFGVRLTGHVPLERSEGTSVEVKGILTRVLSGPWRAHVNAAAVLGEDAHERWWAGAAVDHVLPFRALLLLAETYLSQPRAADAGRTVQAMVGVRWQLTPRTGVDAGIGRAWSGPDPDDWRLTFGITTARGVRALMRTR